MIGLTLKWQLAVRAPALTGLLIAGVSAAAAPPEPPLPRLDVAEESTVKVLPAIQPHWLFLVQWPMGALVAGKVFIVDGDSLQMLGMLSSGYIPNLQLAPDGSRILMSETYYSRATRGTRTDVVTSYDAKTLFPVAETVLPDGRMLAGKRFGAAVSEDGRYMLSANARPATSISVVDLASGTRMAEIPTPGCYLVYPLDARRFASICSNGALLTTSLKEDGSYSRDRGKPFFSPEQDPVYDTPVLSRPDRRGFFISYGGLVHPMHFAAGIVHDEPWPVLTDSERRAEWQPGGRDPLAYHPATDRLFVLMRKGRDLGHIEPGSEVWIFNTRDRLRMARVRLKRDTTQVIVTRDKSPLMFASNGMGVVDVYDISGPSARFRGTIDRLGGAMIAAYVPGE